MSGKVTYEQRDIVLTKFPFSDLTDFKVRPVLVLSKNSYNRKYADVIVCAVTSNLEESEYSHTITTASLEEGHLKVTSKILVDAIANIEQAIILKKIGCLKPVLFNEVLKTLGTLFIDRK